MKESKEEEATDVETKDADEATGGDIDVDAAARDSPREGDDAAAAPGDATPKQKKKRKKLHSATAGSSETEDEGAAANDLPVAASVAAADGNEDDESENYWTACYALKGYLGGRARGGDGLLFYVLMTFGGSSEGRPL